MDVFEDTPSKDEVVTVERYPGFTLFLVDITVELVDLHSGCPCVDLKRHRIVVLALQDRVVW